MKPRLISMVGAMLVLSSNAWAQSTVIPPKPVTGGVVQGAPVSPVQREQINQQLKGNYSGGENNATPLGLINEAWASGECADSHTLQEDVYSPERVFNVRVRQVLGTVIEFPEPVRRLVAGVGDSVTLEPFPNKGANAPSRYWVLGAYRVGTDGNMVFLSSGDRKYHFRVQTEGVHTKNCPMTYLKITGAVHETVYELAARAVAAESSAQPMPEVAALQDDVLPESADSIPGATTPREESGLTGRNNVDWLKGQKFDPSELSFEWRVFGEESLAPDIVFSDCCYVYLHFDPERQSTVALGSLTIVEKTEDGSVDAPVEWDVRGSTVVVRRKGPLTIEREGLVTCIQPTVDLTSPVRKDQWDDEDKV